MDAPQRTLISDDNGIQRFSDGSLIVDGEEYIGECTEDEAADDAIWERFPRLPGDERSIYVNEGFGGALMTFPKNER